MCARYVKRPYADFVGDAEVDFLKVGVAPRIACAIADHYGLTKSYHLRALCAVATSNDEAFSRGAGSGSWRREPYEIDDGGPVGGRGKGSRVV